MTNEALHGPAPAPDSNRPQAETPGRPLIPEAAPVQAGRAQPGPGEVGARDGVSSRGGWRSRKKAIVGWTSGVLAAVLVALAVPPLQSAINGGVDVVTGSEPYTLNVRLGPEDVTLPRAYAGDPNISGDSLLLYGASYYFEAEKLQDLGIPPVVGEDLGCNATRDWATKNGGLDFNLTIGEVVVTASKSLVVRGAQIEASRQRVGEPGEIAVCPIGGPLGAQYLLIDLDEGTVSNFKADSSSERQVDTPVGFQLQPGESERIVFVARSGWKHAQEETLLVKWKIIFDALIDGKPQKITVENQDGSPFRTMVGDFSKHVELVYRAERSAWSSPY